MMITEADIPTAGEVPLITYKAPPLQLELERLVQGDSLPSYPMHTRRVQKIWGAACDALLSDQAAMSELQVLLPAPACQLKTNLFVCVKPILRTMHTLRSQTGSLPAGV